MKKFALLIIVFFGVAFMQGQTTPGFEKVYRGYVTNQKSLWQQGVKELQQAYTATGESNNEILYQLTLGEYGMIGYCLSSENCQDIEVMIEKAIERSKKLTKSSAYVAKGNTLLGALLAMKIGLSPAKAIYLGPRSQSYTQKAMELDANDPATWVEQGNLKFHSPALFGGDNKEAIQCFRKAIKLFDANPQSRASNWLYLHAYAFLGQAQEKEGMLKESIETYKRALSYEPNFKWIKDGLLLTAEKRLNGK